MLIAQWASRFLVRQLSNDAVSLDLTLDWRVLAFTAAITLITVIVFGLAPAVRAARGMPVEALKEAGRGSGRPGRTRVAGGLVVAQVVLSLVLLVGAGLFLRTFTALTSVSLGYDTDRVLLSQVSTRRAEVPPEHRLEAFEQIRQRILSVPGVQANGLSLIGPLGGRMWCRQVIVSGSAMPTEERHTAPSGIGFSSATLPATEPYTALNAVSPGWMTTFGLAMRAGRDISDGDRNSSARVVVVNEAFAHKFLPGENPIGHTMQVVRGSAQTSPREIVGVVSDAAYRNVREAVLPTAYVPLAQYDADASELPPTDIILSVRAASGDPNLLRKVVADAVTEVNPRLTVFFRPLAEQVTRAMVQERLLAMLSAFFGVLAVLLAAIGLYGVTSYGVSLRRSEIGVRLALGATRGRVMRMVFGHVATLVAIGTGLGVAVSLLVTRYVKSLLFGLEPSDPATFVASMLVLATVSVAAGFIPAYRASRLDPAGLLSRG
jgi:predicted permease